MDVDSNSAPEIVEQLLEIVGSAAESALALGTNLNMEIET